MRFTTLSLLASGLTLTSAAPATTSGNPTAPRKLIVSAPGIISLYSFSPNTGFTLINSLPVNSTVPSWLDFATPTTFLAVDENSAAINTFTIDPKANTITADPDASVQGSSGVVHLQLTPDYKTLFASAYGSGTVDIYSVTNSSKPLTKQHTITMGAAQQSHPHQTLFDPTGQFALTNDLGLDKLFISPVTITSISQSTNFSTPTGCGPRHGAWLPGSSADSPVYAVACEKSNQIVTYDAIYNGTSSLSLKQKAVLTSLPPTEEAPPANAAAAGELIASDDGKTVYVSNRRVDSQEGNIAEFSWNGQALSFSKSVDAGGFMPRMMSLAPSCRKEDFLFIGNQSGKKGLVAYSVGANGTIGKEVASLGMEIWGAGTGNGPMFVKEISSC